MEKKDDRASCMEVKSTVTISASLGCNEETRGRVPATKGGNRGTFIENWK